jgi:ribosomal protein S21
MIRQRFPGEHVDAMLRRLKKELGDKMRLYQRSQSFMPRSQRRAIKSHAARKRREA